MAISKTEISQILDSYISRNSEIELQQLKETLNSSVDITSRDNFPIHITTSAVVINDGKVLHIKHKALNKWLLPGGHCESEDTSLIDASLRELGEETGIADDVLLIRTDNNPIDIDLHSIPNQPLKNEPEHCHADFRFVFVLVSDANISLQTEEVDDYAWIPFSQMPMKRLSNRLLNLSVGR